MERVTGELRRIEDLKAAKLINDDEYNSLRKKVLEAPLAAPTADKDPLVDHFTSEALKKYQAWRNSFEDFQLQEAAWKEEDLPGELSTTTGTSPGRRVKRFSHSTVRRSWQERPRFTDLRRSLGL